MSSPLYRVVLTEDVKAVIRQLVGRARALGVSVRLSEALRTIERELEQRPAEWGDPHRHYPDARLTTYLRVHDELAVAYAVHGVKPVLWVTDIVPVLKHPLRS